jgi:hypothetical protein
LLPQELEIEIEELELRLDRLRALYEQYFIGIEKIEPLVPRKDVDRRIWTLRREKIRNTAKRFKLQTLIQRYNTYQQYWHRIIREIESGTYKRHVRKAELGADQLLTVQARRRFQHQLLALEQAAAEAREASERPESTAPEPEPAAPARAKPAAPPAKPGVQAKSQVPSWHPPATRPPPSAGLLPRPGVGRGRRSAHPEDPAPNGAQSGSSSELPPPRKQQATLPGTTLSALLSNPGGADPAARRRAPPPTFAGDRQAPQPRPAPPSAAASSGAASPSAASPTARSTVAISPAVSMRPPPPPRPAPPPPRAASLAPPLNSNPTAAQPRPLAGSLAARPAPASPSAATGQARVSPAAVAQAAARPVVKSPAASPTRSASESALSEDKIRQLHERLLAAKRQVGDRQAPTVEALARTVRESEAKLRAQHGGRKVDFDVMVKDGKAVLRPVLKKSE